MQEIYTDSSTHGCSHFAQRSASPHFVLFMSPTLTQLHVDVELSEQKIWRRLARKLLFAAPCANPSLSPPYSPLVPFSEKHILVRDERCRDCGAAAIYLAVGQYIEAPTMTEKCSRPTAWTDSDPAGKEKERKENLLIRYCQLARMACDTDSSFVSQCQS
jgi:hypothetical protein